MDNSNGNICLVTFLPIPEAKELLLTLKNTGYRTKIIQSKNPTKLLKKLDFDIIILLLDDNTGIKNSISLFLDTLNETPVLPIFLKTNKHWDLEIIHHCTDFVSWPSPQKELEIRLERMFVKLNYSLTKEIKEKKLTKEINKIHFIGNSHTFLKTLKKVKKLSKYNVTTLIEGETGTGKDLVARTIHQLSQKSNGPFVAVNCGAIPEGLFENELFGHQKGAFTNAYSKQIGLVEQANGGTLFLDEVDTLNYKGQMALLRFLQDGRYKPLGNESFSIADVRIIAATNSNLICKIKKQEFREDLFYRLRILDIQIPPLRERGNDAQILAQHFIGIYKKLYNQPSKFLDPKFIKWINKHNWPGNVRELENLIHREFILSEDDNIGLCAFINGENNKTGISHKMESFISTERDFKSVKAEVISIFEKEYLKRILSESNGNVTLAAKRSGKERRALGKLLKKHRIGDNW